jgi:hypothetical protein
MADALERYLTDPAERRAAGLRGREFVIAEFEAGATTDLLLRLMGHDGAASAPVPESVR